MMKLLASIIALLFVMPTVVMSYEVTDDEIIVGGTAIDAGITPDSIFYGLDVALDNIRMILTFDENEKARLGLMIARERLMEAKKMLEEGKEKEAMIAEEHHDRIMEDIRDRIRRGKITSEEVKKDLEEHEKEVSMVKEMVMERVREHGFDENKIEEMFSKMSEEVKHVKEEVGVCSETCDLGSNAGGMGIVSH